MAENYLINGDFRINQRNEKSYDVFNKHSVDRWHVGGHCKVEVNDDGTVTVTNLSAKEGSYTTFTNILEEDISGVPVVASVCFGNGVVVSGKAVAEKKFNFIEVPYKNARLKVYWSNNIPRYAVTVYVCGPKQSVTIKWVKLEFGHEMTPFYPKATVREMNDCLRYYQVFKPEDNGIICSLVATEKDRLEGVIPKYVPMRHNGIAGFKGELFAVLGKNRIKLENVELLTTQSAIQLKCSAKGVKKGCSYLLKGDKDAQIFVDAELRHE
ncbi:MAG: hypothetical protein J6A51_01030 [Clostridia bacterium]|nr:hypothetical protein [Clostridia bacterium]